MLIPYQALLTLPSETVDKIIKEHLLMQMEDGSFSDFDPSQFEQAIILCKQKLASGELIVEYSEDDESIAIKTKEQLM